jgi:hypothetical protein
MSDFALAEEVSASAAHLLTAAEAASGLTGYDRVCPPLTSRIC